MKQTTTEILTRWARPTDWRYDSGTRWLNRHSGSHWMTATGWRSEKHSVRRYLKDLRSYSDLPMEKLSCSDSHWRWAIPMGSPRLTGLPKQTDSHSVRRLCWGLQSRSGTLTDLHLKTVKRRPMGLRFRWG